ncbi:DinB family protein [Microlunatus ginsengisoli]|uniref:DinB family protein n=1 Tax=Microlunatus ginsengisoli TaxID=363863 RepID=A0ABP7A5Z9_9ACTN
MSSAGEKETLQRYLDKARTQLVAKLDGLDELEIRRPMTPTGTNLLGLVKHVASVQLGYLGEVFGRPSEIALPWFDDGAELNADLWATPEETRESILELHRGSAAHADATVAALELDARGVVPWWRPENREVTLHQILVHLIDETARHAGHADILRELIDGRAGNDDGNLPGAGEVDWPDYRRRIEAAAVEAAARDDG